MRSSRTGDTDGSEAWLNRSRVRRGDGTRASRVAGTDPLHGDIGRGFPVATLGHESVILAMEQIERRPHRNSP